MPIAVNIFHGEERKSVIYLHDEQASDLFSLLQERFTIVLIQGNDWENDFTPYPHPKVFHGGHDFGGKADVYLTDLVQNIVPKAEQKLGFTPNIRILAGYSLAGLFALYAGMKRSLFNAICCCSGSLWYPDFLSRLSLLTPPKTLKQAYFSIGERESKNHNPYLSQAETCMIQARDYLASQGVKTIFQRESGGHFEPSAPRLARGLAWILSENTPSVK